MNALQTAYMASLRHADRLAATCRLMSARRALRGDVALEPGVLTRPVWWQLRSTSTTEAPPAANGELVLAGRGCAPRDASPVDSVRVAS